MPPAFPRQPWPTPIDPHVWNSPKHVRTEASLHILAYNFKRLIAILGVGPLIAAIQT